MKIQKTALVIASIFLAVFLIGLTSAELTFSSVPTLNPDGSSATITISSTENETVNFTITNIDSNGKTITFDAISDITINDSEPQTITITYIVPSDFEFEFQEEYFTTLTATGEISEAKSQKISFEKNTDACAIENPGTLRVDIRDITVLPNGFGDDDEWFIFDEVEVEVRVENNGNADIENVVLEWGIYDPENNEWVIELDEEDEFDLDENDEQDFIISFTIDEDMDVDLEDLEDGNYIFYAVATGEVVDGDYEGEDTCDFESNDIKIIIERNFVILRDLEIPEMLQCDSEFSISGDVWNIGSKDQKDVSVRVINTQLGIDETILVGDIESMESEPFNYNLQIGEDADEGQYTLQFFVLDDDEEVYQNDFDDEESEFDIKITLTENCGVSNDVTISAVLEDGGKAGKPLTIKATIVNTGTKPGTFLVNIANYASWAELSGVSQNTLVLEAGQSEEILITLDVNKDTSGEEVFNIEVLSENKLIANQPVSVTIANNTFSISNLINSDNWQIWAIGFLNVILIIAIIVVAVRIARK